MSSATNDIKALVMMSQFITLAEAVGVMTMVLTMVDGPTLSVSITCIVSPGPRLRACGGGRGHTSTTCLLESCNSAI